MAKCINIAVVDEVDTLIHICALVLLPCFRNAFFNAFFNLSGQKMTQKCPKKITPGLSQENRQHIRNRMSLQYLYSLHIYRIRVSLP